MEDSKLFSVIAPFGIILFGSVILFSLRFFNILQFYGKNLIIAVPIVDIFYMLSAVYFLVFREKNGLAEIGLCPKKEQLTLSIMLGLLAGIFFFMIYIGAHPERKLPTWNSFFRFNLYFLFCVISEEMIFRVWVIHSLKTLFRPRYMILISSLIYMFAALATVGKDNITILTGRIDGLLVFETIFQSFLLGLILAYIYYKTKSIYGNILFIFISSIPQLYEINGLAHKVNSTSSYIALLGLLLFLLLIFILRSIKPSNQIAATLSKNHFDQTYE